MKKIAIASLASLLVCAAPVKAQKLLDKIESALNKAERASNTADRTTKTGGKVAGLFGKKKNAAAETTAAATTPVVATVAEIKTTIKISGINFANLKSVSDKMQASKGVKSTKMTFSPAASTITVQHTGSTEELLAALQKNIPDVFAEKNIDGLSDGEISIKIKK